MSSFLFVYLFACYGTGLYLFLLNEWKYYSKYNNAAPILITLFVCFFASPFTVPAVILIGIAGQISFWLAKKKDLKLTNQFFKREHDDTR